MVRQDFIFKGSDQAIYYHPDNLANRVLERNGID